MEKNKLLSLIITVLVWKVKRKVHQKVLREF